VEHLKDVPLYDKLCPYSLTLQNSGKARQSKYANLFVSSELKKFCEYSPLGVCSP
jgi:hypothetical protein